MVSRQREQHVSAGRMSISEPHTVSFKKRGAIWFCCATLLLQFARIPAAEALYVSPEDLWPRAAGADRIEIPVCFREMGAHTAELRRWTQEAAESTWGALGPVTFVRWDLCTPPDLASGGIVAVRFNDDCTDGNSCSPWAGVGFNANAPTEMRLLLSFANHWRESQCSDENLELCTREYAVHEFGHVLGFRHEQDRPDTPDTCSDKGDPVPDAVTFNPWDDKSVMNYCSDPRLGGGILSRSDKAGFQSYYGGVGTLEAILLGDAGANASGFTDLIIPTSEQGDLYIATFGLDAALAGFQSRSDRSMNHPFPQGEEQWWFTGQVDTNPINDVILIHTRDGGFEISAFPGTPTGYEHGRTSLTKMNDQNTLLAWLTGDVDRDGLTDLIQVYLDHSGMDLHIDVYRRDANGYSLESENDYDYAVAPYQALHWLAVEGAGGAINIVQVRSASTTLELQVFPPIPGGGFYAPTGTTYPGVRAMSGTWLTGNFTGGGITDLALAYPAGARTRIAVLQGQNVPGAPAFTHWATQDLSIRSGTETDRWFSGTINTASAGLNDLVSVTNAGGKARIASYIATGNAAAPFSINSNQVMADLGYGALDWHAAKLDANTTLDLVQFVKRNGSVFVNSILYIPGLTEYATTYSNALHMN